MRVFEKIYKVVRQIPKGKATTYGKVAKEAGVNPRIVGWALHRSPDPLRIPCHRVVDRDGKLAENYAFGKAGGQKQRLEAEGIKIKEKDKNYFVAEDTIFAS